MSALMPRALVYVEGKTDIPVVHAVMRAAGWEREEFTVFALRGSAKLEARLREQASLPSPILRVFMRDADGQCPVDIRKRLLPKGSADTVVLRVCDDEIESWLLADDVGFSRFFNMPLSKVESPNGVDAKERMLGCVSRYGKRNIKEFVRQESKIRGGRAYIFGARYETILTQFITDEWNIDRAAQRSDSLKRALQRLSERHERF